MTIPPLRPPQARTIPEFLALVARGVRRILLTMPTGGGKTRLAIEIVKIFLAEGYRVAWYTHRRMLLEQTAEVFEGHGLLYGVRAAGHHPEFHHEFQLCSLQTERARSDSLIWPPHTADLAIFDEAHLMANDTAARIMGQHLENPKSVILGLTATPIGLSQFYDQLLVGGTIQELRECGALVRAVSYAPDEPDLKGIGKWSPGDDLSDKQQRAAMGSVDRDGTPDRRLTVLAGRVIEHWRRLNPEGKPTILFAPGVKESLWFAQEFVKAGVSAAHIDGEEIWHDGQLVRSTPQLRAEVLNGSRDSRISVLCNRFVLREGIDAPWLAHGIMACVFGSLQTYLQSGGRLLRAYPGLDSVVLQDHGGNVRRHGSLNSDREWDIRKDAKMIAHEREERLREKIEQEPFRCPKCNLILLSLKCSCGYLIPPGLKTRAVLMRDGNLIELKGDVYPPRKRAQHKNTLQLWYVAYIRAFNGGKTFAQMEAQFEHEHYYRPPKGFPIFPKEDHLYWRKVRDVPVEDLIDGYPPGLPFWVEKQKRAEQQGDST